MTRMGDTFCHLLLLFWHAPLEVRSAVRGHQPSQKTVLSHVDCFVQCGVVGCLVSVQPHDTRTPTLYHVPPGGLFQLSGGGAVRVILSYSRYSGMRELVSWEQHPFRSQAADEEQMIVVGDCP